MKNYSELAILLDAKGIGSYMQSPERMIISGQTPAMPNGNCFWVTLRRDGWIVGTFLPAIYKVSNSKCIGEICEAIFKSSETAIYKVNPDLVGRFNLRELTDEDAD